jgi:hypothetical protein
MAMSLLMLAFLLSTVSSHAQSAVASEVHAGNEFVLELTPTTITVGEPIFLKFRINNTSGILPMNNFSGRMHFSEGNDIDIRVQAPGELPRRYNGIDQAGLFAALDFSVERQKTMESDYLLFFDEVSPRGLLFDRPGTYILSVRLTGSVYRDRNKQVVFLPPTPITVRESERPDHGRIMDVIGRPEAARALHQTITGNETLAQEFQQFVSNFPDSPWTPLVLTVLANRMSNANPPNNQAAARLFTELAKRFPNSPRAPGAMFTAALCYHQDKKHDLARAAYWLARDLYPSYYLFRQENPVAFFYEFGPRDQVKVRPWFHFAQPYVMGREIEDPDTIQID